MLVVLGVSIFAMYGIGAVLSSPTMNEAKSMDVPVTSPETLVGIDMGTAETISSVTLTFRSALVANTDVTITIKDSDGVSIGSGTVNLGTAQSIVTINLSDTITSTERPNIRNVTVTAA